VETQVVATNVDVGPKGVSIGDYVVFTGALVRPGAATTVGSDAVICTVLKTEPTAPLQCVGTAQLRAGDITFQGLFVAVTGRHNTLAVTGGTHAYRTAKGEFVATALKDGSTDEVYRLNLWTRAPGRGWGPCPLRGGFTAAAGAGQAARTGRGAAR
jgi:hypothetical protein